MRSPWIHGGWLIVAYAVAAAFSWWLQPANTDSSAAASTLVQSAPVWLGAGVLFVAFWRTPRSASLLLAAWVAACAWGLIGHGLGLAHAAVFGAIETSAAWLGAVIARTPTGHAHSLRAMLRLMAGAALTAVLGACLAAGFWLWTGVAGAADWSAEWRTWTLSTLTGILLLAPVALAYQGFQARRSGGMPQRQFVAGLIAFALFVLLAWMVFSPGVQRTGTMAPTLAYLPMPLLLAASMLWGPRGGSLAWLLGGLLVVVRSASGAGPFALEDAFAGEALAESQAFVTIWSVLMLFGRGLEHDRTHALQNANQWRLRYERAMGAQQVLTVEFDAVTSAATWAPGSEHILGSSMQALDSMPAWLAHVDAADRPLAQLAWQQACAGQTPPPQTYDTQLGPQRRTVQASLAPVEGPDGTVEIVTAWIRVQPAGAA